jgi:hypothetical protein
MMSAIRNASRFAPALVLASAFAVAGMGCSNNGGQSAQTMAAAQPAMTPAATLRVTLDTLLQEHIYLASAATDAALAGNNAEFTSAAGALDANSTELSQAIGSVYGADAATSFLALWRKHIGFFVDYTQGVAAKDQAKQDKAVSDLIGYTQDFGAFVDTATGSRLKKDQVADLVKGHVVGLKTVVDDQAAKNYDGAYTQERKCSKDMQPIGDALAGAIVAQFPDKF